MLTTLRNGMICGLAASMAGILTACNIVKATMDSISGFFLPAVRIPIQLSTKTIALIWRARPRLERRHLLIKRSAGV